MLHSVRVYISKCFRSILLENSDTYHSFFLTGARNVYHQLFMSSLLMDLKYKKLFAIRFARVSIFLKRAIKCLNILVKRV